MEILGHSQMSTTARYQHVLPQMHRDAADKMDELFGHLGRHGRSPGRDNPSDIAAGSGVQVGVQAETGSHTDP